MYPLVQYKIAAKISNPMFSSSGQSLKKLKIEDGP